MKKTIVFLVKLDYNQKRDEIARLIAGSNITEKTIQHADEIIELAKK